MASILKVSESWLRRQVRTLPPSCYVRIGPRLLRFFPDRVIAHFQGAE